MTVRVIAPAKINWTLEVLGKRWDGYHEVRTVLQTVDLCDEVAVGNEKCEMGNGGVGNSKPETRVSVVRSGPATLVAEGAHVAREDDLMLQAVRLLEEMTGRELPVEIQLVKRIPVGAGLGGGSADTGAVLRGLRALHGLEVTDAELLAVAAGVGSDAPFFLRGGTALGSGRGEEITPLLDAPEAWFVVLAPPISIADKTRRMYAALEASDFTNGRRTEDVVAAIRRGEPVPVECLFNGFDSAATRMFPELEAYRQALMDASGDAVHMAGAGPALFAVFGSRKKADVVAGRLEGTDARVFVARTLGAEEATRVEVS